MRRRRGKAVGIAAGVALLLVAVSATAFARTTGDPLPVPPAPQPAVRPPSAKAVPTLPQTVPASPQRAVVAADVAEGERLKRVRAAQTWGYQLNGATVDALAASPFDMLVIDATTGLSSGRHFTRAEVERLKRKPDGGRRLVVSYLSIGEAEDYRPEYFTPEYLEEDAPDWLMKENPDWKGNRLVNVCLEGWKRTILGDDNGRSVYDGVHPSPLYRLIELGFDGVYLDRVDVWEETKKQCPDGEARMVDFVIRLGAHARKADPYFLVVQQNAESLLKHPRLVKAIDAVAKEGLFYSWMDGGKAVSASSTKWSVDLLNVAKAAGRGVFVVDYTGSNKSNAETAQRRNRDLGYVPYAGPKELNTLWLPGKHF